MPIPWRFSLCFVCALSTARLFAADGALRGARTLNVRDFGAHVQGTTLDPIAVQAA